MRTSYVSAKHLPADAWKWPHVDPAKEWACKGTGRITVETEFLDRFELLRADCGFALPITSGFRTPAYNAKVSSTGTRGPHTTARALDLLVPTNRSMTVVRLAIAHGYTGIGVKKSAQSGHVMIHLDDLEATDARYRPALWAE